MRRLSRLAVALFCVVTAVYAFLASSSFAYQQFLRPRVIVWVAHFADWHAVVFWPWLAMALVSLRPKFTSPNPVRWLAWSFAAAGTMVGIALAVHPVLPALVDDHRSLATGVAALVPLVWLALMDHLGHRQFLRLQPQRVTDDEAAATEGRMLVAAFGTAIVVPLLYAALTPAAIGGAFEPDLLATGLTIGLAWSILEHGLIFGVAFLALALTARILRPIRSFALRYTIDLALLTAALWLTLERLFGRAIGLDDAWGDAAMLALSVSVVATWAAIRLDRCVSESTRLVSGFDVFFGAARTGPLGMRPLGSLLVTAIAAFVLARIAGRLDWDFLLLKFGVIGIWVAIFFQLYRATPNDLRFNRTAIFLACGFPLVLHYSDSGLQRHLPRWFGASKTTIRHALDRYVVYNPAFRVADDALHDRSADVPSFGRFIRANTGLSAGSVSPVSIDFASHLQKSSMNPRPFVFFLVVDSLRPDYLSPYNGRVGFTPRIDEFAADSLVFRNAFTRYGGTGLSMSAIWMGAAGPHRQYVQPFQPMNALEKLLAANEYRRYVSMDHIMMQLLTPSPSLVELDRGIPELQYDFCRTLKEIEGDLDRSGSAAPVFAHTRSLNLHVAAITGGSVPAGESYPGFEARYASRVHRMDACFGTFIDALKRRGLYERSVIILTADHGEMLGEDQQWGHAYYLFPAVLQIPLIVRLPPSLARGTIVDLDAIGFSTDITPTLYSVLGYVPQRPNGLSGRSLLARSAGEVVERRRATEVVAASYGAVWGALRQNGRRLYIADANHGREYAYERAPRGPWRSVAVDDAMRAVNQQAIRQHVEEIAHVYGTTNVVNR